MSVPATPAVRGEVSPATTSVVAVAGVTESVPVPLALPSAPVMVWSPAAVDVQLVPVQEPPPLMVKVAAEVTSPRLLP